MDYKISEETANKLLAYLENRPFKEVNTLINLLLDVGNNPIVEKELIKKEVKFNGKNTKPIST